MVEKKVRGKKKKQQTKKNDPRKLEKFDACAALGMVCHFVGDFDDARRNHLSVTLREKGQYEEAEEVYKRCLTGRMKVLGKDHDDRLGTLNNLGVVYQRLGNNEKELEYYERALKGYERLLGKNHPQTLMAVMNIAIVYTVQKDYGKADELYERALKGYEAQLGKYQGNTMRCAENYRKCLEKSGNSAGLAELKKAHPNVDNYDVEIKAFFLKQARGHIYFYALNHHFHLHFHYYLFMYQPENTVRVM